MSIVRLGRGHFVTNFGPSRGEVARQVLGACTLPRPQGWRGNRPWAQGGSGVFVSTGKEHSSPEDIDVPTLANTHLKESTSVVVQKSNSDSEDWKTLIGSVEQGENSTKLYFQKGPALRVWESGGTIEIKDPGLFNEDLRRFIKNMVQAQQKGTDLELCVGKEAFETVKKHPNFRLVLSGTPIDSEQL